MPWEFVGKSTNYTKVRVMHRLYTTLHKTILKFYWKQCSRFVFIKDCLPSFVKMAAFWAEMGVAYLEINKLPCLHVWCEKKGVWNLNLSLQSSRKTFWPTSHSDFLSCRIQESESRNGKLVALGWKQPLQEKLDIFVRE
jgi:hypothetical protein